MSMSIINEEVAKFSWLFANAVVACERQLCEAMREEIGEYPASSTEHLETMQEGLAEMNKFLQETKESVRIHSEG